MKKLGLKGKKWLKGIHIILPALWLGAGVSVLLLGFTKTNIPDADKLVTAIECSKMIDDFIIVPTAIATLISGIFICWLTNWGFFKFKWIIVKWVIMIFQIILGTFLLGPWKSEALSIAREQGAQALQNPSYIQNIQMSNYLGLVQMSLIIAVIFISVFKPWSKRKKED